jgi:hypothetical protein
LVNLACPFAGLTGPKIPHVAFNSPAASCVLEPTADVFAQLASIKALSSISWVVMLAYLY